MRFPASLIQTSLALIWTALLTAASLHAADLDRSGTQWAPVLQWELKNATVDGNPFDLPATATFVHEASGERRTTGMFYDGDDTWKFRFTATRPGRWTFFTSSADPNLDGRSGTVTIAPNPSGYGFVTHAGNKWARPRGESGELEAFVPQYVMYDGPDVFYRKPDRIDAHIRSALVEHGFTGFHVPVLCRWFDIGRVTSNEIASDDPNPDPRTFEALELLTTRTHAAGGVANIWGYLLPDRSGHANHGPSFPYLNRAALHTYAEFFRGRFLLEMERANDLTDGVCLRHPANFLAFLPRFRKLLGLVRPFLHRRTLVRHVPARLEKRHRRGAVGLLCGGSGSACVRGACRAARGDGSRRCAAAIAA